MPNIITHALCANDVLQQLSDSKLKQLILKYPRVFSMASSGPDFLFYYKALPFQEAKDAKPVHEVGNVVHKKWINRFYQKAIELLKAETENKEILTVFLAGHLM
ncbi:MAG: zinc dependent phospholipase C family protein, partial [Erysipelotrichaceae bacterium]